MTNLQVTRFSFVGGKARPVKQPLSITGVNSYDERQVVFSVTRTTAEGEEKTSHVMSLALSDVPAFATAFKQAVSDAKVATDSTPPEARKRLDARKAKEDKATTSQPAPTDVNAVLEALKAAGYSITPPSAPQTSPAPTPAPKAPAKRGTTHTKPSTVTAPKVVPALDDLDEISTSELEAVSNIMAMLLGKRGMK